MLNKRRASEKPQRRKKPEMTVKMKRLKQKQAQLKRVETQLGAQAQLKKSRRGEKMSPRDHNTAKTRLGGRQT